MSRPVTLLILDSTGRGGLARAVVNVANQLVAHRDVRVLSLFRRHEEARYPLDPRIRHEVLIDEHAGLGMWQRRQARRTTQLGPAAGDGELSALTDAVLVRRLQTLEPGVLVTTRPSLHLAGTTWAPPRTQVVGWDHKNFPTRFSRAWMGETLEQAVPALDAYVVLTRADADDYRRHLGLPADRVRVIRNALSWPAVETPATLENPVVVAAGRLAAVKGFSRLIDAFAPVAHKHPGWQLHIHGEGDRRDKLEARVERHGLGGQILLPGWTDDLAGALRTASAYAMTSKAEGFPMVLLEAMAEGLPLVSMDCPRGPGEIVEHGGNGLLVADGDVDGFTRALLAVVEDADLRRRLGHRAWLDADRYTTARVTADWLALLVDLDARAVR